MSVSITISHALKKYGDNTVIPDLSLKIRDGEFFTLLGPSGCGKTTLLRMIAGFNSIEGGDFYFNDRRINDMDPGERNTGMVFQNYALFPHMNVRKNVEYGLTSPGRKFSKQQIRELSDKYLELMQITQYADRMPEELSGGQQQRVALARALVISPDVLLMDEPLCNLDAKLRIEMRQVIRDIQQNVGITTVYVTHDQEEAMAFSDRIAVMNAGVIQHVGTPEDIYQRPSNVFVAGFIGRTNFLEGELQADQNGCRLVFGDGYAVPISTVRPECRHTQKVSISARPEELILTDGESEEGISAEVLSSTFLGQMTHYIVRLDTGEEARIVRESSIGSNIQPGSQIRLKLNAEKVNLFDTETKESLMTGVNNMIPGEEGS